MIINEKILVRVTYGNKKNYIKYNPIVGEVIEIDSIDLSKNSQLKINYECDICKNIFSTKYQTYNRSISQKSSVSDLQGLSLCKKCTYIKSKRTMLNKYGYESYQSTKEYRDIIYEKYGVSNISKLQDVKNKKIESAIKKYGVDNVAKSKEVIDKMKSTMILRYGFDNPTKNREIFEKAQSSAYKTYKFEDTNLKYQGSYELDFIKFTRSRNIKIENGPSIRYEMNLVNRIYHSDFYLPDFNLICEIKSTYTFNCDYDENLMKQKFAIKSGYNFLFIIDKNYSDLEKIINENATE